MAMIAMMRDKWVTSCEIVVSLGLVVLLLLLLLAVCEMVL